MFEVTRTYLEMRAPSELRPGRNDDPLIAIELQHDCPVELFRFLYAEVGKNYYWIDRLPWTDEQIAAYLQQPEVSVWLMTYDGETAGYGMALVNESHQILVEQDLGIDFGMGP